MTDDITRLADRAEALWQRTGNDEAYYIADELRAIVRQQGKAGGVAVYEVQERMSSFAPSSRWTETTRETYEGGYFPETLFHRRILYATPPTHIPDAGNMVSANPPEAGVMDEMVERAYARYADYLKALGYVEPRPHKSALRAALTAALAPQPKDAT